MGALLYSVNVLVLPRTEAVGRLSARRGPLPPTGCHSQHWLPDAARSNNVTKAARQLRRDSHRSDRDGCREACQCSVGFPRVLLAGVELSSREIVFFCCNSVGVFMAFLSSRCVIYVLFPRHILFRTDCLEFA